MRIAKLGICENCLNETFVVSLNEGSPYLCEKCISKKFIPFTKEQEMALEEEMDYINEKTSLEDVSNKINSYSTQKVENGLELAEEETNGHVPMSFSVLTEPYLFEDNGSVGTISPPSPPIKYKEVKMGESQSRFSIIDSLTEKKVSNLDQIEDLKAKIENTKTQITRTEEDTKNALKRKIEDLNQQIKNFEEQIKNKKEIVKELDKGIDAIEKVSKDEKKKD